METAKTMHTRISIKFSVALALGIIALIAFWLWKDYALQRKYLESTLSVRAQSTLSSLEAGLNTHRVIGRWFLESIDSYMAEMASAPGVLGLAIYDDDGGLLASGGSMQESDCPTSMTTEGFSKSLWRPEGMALFKRTLLNRATTEESEPPPLLESNEYPMNMRMFERMLNMDMNATDDQRQTDGKSRRQGVGGRGPEGRQRQNRLEINAEFSTLTLQPGANMRGMGRGMGMMMGSGPESLRPDGPRGGYYGSFGGPPRTSEELSEWRLSVGVEALFRQPIRIGVLLDRSEFDNARRKANWRFGISMSLTLAAVGLALGLLVSFMRQERLVSELSLGLEREKRLEERSQLGAGLAHETKNPLSLIRGLAQSMARKYGEADKAQALNENCANAGRIVDEVDRVVGRVNSFLEFARTLSPQISSVNLRIVLDETMILFQDEAAEKKVNLHVSSPHLHIKADSNMLRQVLVNLLVNSQAACSEGDQIEIIAVRDDANTCSFEVHDTGRGIEPADMDSVLKPYYTRNGGGTGLGLSIVDQIAQSHGWELSIESQPGVGTKVRLGGIRVSAGA